MERLSLAIDIAGLVIELSANERSYRSAATTINQPKKGRKERNGIARARSRPTSLKLLSMDYSTDVKRISFS